MQHGSGQHGGKAPRSTFMGLQVENQARQRKFCLGVKLDPVTIAVMDPNNDPF